MKVKLQTITSVFFVLVYERIVQAQRFPAATTSTFLPPSTAPIPSTNFSTSNTPIVSTSASPNLILGPSASMPPDFTPMPSPSLFPEATPIPIMDLPPIPTPLPIINQPLINETTSTMAPPPKYELPPGPDFIDNLLAANETIRLAIPQQELRAQFEPSDFVFDLNGSDPIQPVNAGGTIRKLTVNQLPSLQGQGLAYKLTTIEPCGMLLPQSNARAAEFSYIINGSNVRSAFVEDNGSKVYVNDLQTGMAIVFPQGLIHYQQNMGCETATVLSALASDDPGEIAIMSQLFMIDDVALADVFNQDIEQMSEIRDALPLALVEGSMECSQQCSSGSSTSRSGSSQSSSMTVIHPASYICFLIIFLISSFIQ